MFSLVAQDKAIAIANNIAVTDWRPNITLIALMCKKVAIHPSKLFFLFDIWACL